MTTTDGLRAGTLLAGVETRHDGCGPSPFVVLRAGPVEVAAWPIDDDFAAFFTTNPREMYAFVHAGLGAIWHVGHGPGCRWVGPTNAATERPVQQRRRRITRALLHEVAAVYRKAVTDGEPPTITVAGHFGVSHSTAARWVGQARKAGALGPAAGPTAGEVASANA